MTRTNRDDFTEATKQNAARRVGYLCSCPECGKLTIGASYERKDKSANIGVAAHICAAAPNGPRYDPNMTAEQRKSIDNCLWLCQTHAHLIDCDETIYTKDLLLKWKQNAELNAAKALALNDINFFEKYSQQYGENSLVISNLFDQFIIDGNFNSMHKLLETYNYNCSEFFSEFVLRYQIIYDIYCDHISLASHLKKYVDLNYQSGVNSILELLCSLLLSEFIPILMPHCSDSELKKICEKVMNKTILNDVIVTSNQDAIIIEPRFINVYNKIITLYLYKNSIFGLYDNKGNPFKEYDQDFFFEIISKIYSVNKHSYYYDFFRSEKNYYEDVIKTIMDQIVTINQLDISYKTEIWKFILLFTSEFNYYYDLCPSDIKNQPEIKEILYSNNIDNNIDSISVDELIQFSKDNHKYHLVYMYLTHCNSEYSVEFLNNHRFLFDEDCIFIYLFLITLKTYNKIEKPLDFLRQYHKKYFDCFLFHCIIIQFCSENDLPSEIKWIKDNKEKMKMEDMSILIPILSNLSQWDLLAELSNLELPYDLMIRIANALSADSKNYIKAYEIFSRIIDSGYKMPKLFLAQGDICNYLGRLNEAEKCYKNEFDYYKNKNALARLLELRYRTKNCDEDCYFNSAKDVVDAQIQNNIASIYMIKCEKNKANLFFLRSLIINDESIESMNGYFFSSCNLQYNKKTVDVRENVVCELFNDQGTKRIAIHSHDVLVGIDPNNFAGCCHFCIEDPIVSSWRWKRIGDTVIFESEEYIIKSINPSMKFFSQFAISFLNSHNTIKTISENDNKEMIKKIAEVIQDSNDNLIEVINNNNSAKIRLPLSIFAKLTGKSRIETLGFLLNGNEKKYRNNLNHITLNSEDTFIISYECIVVLSKMGIMKTITERHHIVCTKQVRDQLAADIEEQLNEIVNENRKAVMYLLDGKLAVYELSIEDRQNQYTRLTCLKSDLALIDIIDNNDWDFTDKNLVKELYDQDALCECSCLGAGQNNEFIVLTDDEFIYSLTNVCKIKNIGICDLIAQSGFNSSELIKISRQLRTCNYGIYLTPLLYKAIIVGKDSDALKELDEWLVTDTESDPTEYHRSQIINLFKEVLYFEPGVFNLDEMFFLAKYDLFHREYFAPGTINKIIEKHNETVQDLIADSDD